MVRDYRLNLDDGAVLYARNIQSVYGKTLVDIEIKGVDGGSYTASRLDLSRIPDRKDVARDASNRNGKQPKYYEDLLGDLFISISQPVGMNIRSLGGLPEPPPIDWHIPMLIAPNMPNTIYGDSGTGKSTTVLSLGLNTVLGIEKWLGMPCKKGNVLYLDYELDQDYHVRRLYSLLRGMKLDRIPDGFFYDDPKASIVELRSQVKQAIVQKEIALVIFDSIGKGGGADALGPTQPITDLMDALRGLGPPVIAVDHQAAPVKGVGYQNMREYGRAQKRWFTRSSIQLECVSNDSGKSALVMRQVKSSFGAKLPPIYFYTKYIDDGYEIVLQPATGQESEFLQSAATSVREKIIATLRDNGRMSIDDIVTEIDGKRGTVKNNLHDLAKSKKVVSLGDGVYEIV